MKNRIIAAIMIFLGGNLFAQWQAIEEWSVRYNGPGNGIDLLSTMTLDPIGNVYVTGRSGGSGTGQDYATLKYSPKGQSLLELRYNHSGSSWDEASDIAVDGLGNIYITGTSIASGITTIKYDPLGDTLWIASFNSLGGAEGLGITIDSLYYVYVGGNVWNAGPGADIAVIKYSPGGTELWATFLRGNSSYDNGFVDLEIDDQGNVYVTGNTTNELSEDIFYNDFITAKLNSGGIEEWRQYYSRSSLTDDIPVGLGIDGQGNIIIGGASYKCPDPYNCDNDYVVIKYSPLGVEEWIKTYESPSANEDIPMDIVIDSQDNIIITGYSWRDTEDFNYLTIKYDPGGNELWITEYNGSGNKRDFALAATLDSQDNIYVTGGSRQGVTGDDEAVTVRYNPNGDQAWVISYSDSESSSNIGYSIATDNEQSVYIGLHSIGNSSGWDYLTIKYRQGIMGVSDKEELSNKFNLYQNYPNPFNPYTIIKYQLDRASPVVLEIFNNLGQKLETLVNELQPPGNYKIRFDGSNLSSGVYYYRIKAGDFSLQKKMLLTK